METIENKEDDFLNAVFNDLSNKIYIIGETTANQNEVNKALCDATKQIQGYFDSHKQLSEDDKKKAFFQAAAVGDESIINIFIQEGCNIDEKNEKGETPLMVAATCGNVSTLNALLNHGANIDVKSNCGWSVEKYASMIKDTMKSNDGMAKLGCISTLISARIRYPNGNPFAQCIELIKNQQKDKALYFHHKYAVITGILIIVGIYYFCKSKV